MLKWCLIQMIHDCAIVFFSEKLLLTFLSSAKYLVHNMLVASIQHISICLFLCKTLSVVLSVPFSEDGYVL